MDFQLNEDQRAFADMAQGLFADYCSDEALRAHDVSDAPLQQALWAQCVAAGLHSILVPEAAGGLGQGMTALMAVLEAQGRALAQVPLWEQQLAVAALAHFGPSADGEGLPDVQAGALEGRLLALSLDALHAARGAGVRAVSGRLQGVAPAVGLGDVADHALVAAETPQGLRLAVVQVSAPGVHRRPGRSQHHRGVADLQFDAAPVMAWLPSEATTWVEQRALACAAALQLGVTAQQLQRTVQYVSERQQFGRVIGSFQLVAGQMADGYVATEALRVSLWQLVWRLDAGLPCVPQAHATRTLANEAGHRAGHMAQHVHGGIGVDLTYPIHRYLYWSRALGSQLGGTELHLSRLGDWLAEHDTLGWKFDLAEDR